MTRSASIAASSSGVGSRFSDARRRCAGVVGTTGLICGLKLLEEAPGSGCSNVTVYECFDGPSAGRCSAHNWMYNPACLRSCVHVSTLNPAPYYALWVDAALA